jgi:hypothetical protein
VSSPHFPKQHAHQRRLPADEDARFLQNPIPFGKVDLSWTQEALKDSPGYGVVSVDGGLKEPLEGKTHGATMWMQSFICSLGGGSGVRHLQEQ